MIFIETAINLASVEADFVQFIPLLEAAAALAMMTATRPLI